MMSAPVLDQNIYSYNESVASDNKGMETAAYTDSSDATNKDKDFILPASVLKQLAVAIESEKNFRTVKEILLSSASSSPVRERASLSLSAVKSLVIREIIQEKEGRINSDVSDDDVWSFIQTILHAERLSPCREVGFLIETSNTISLPRELRGAPPESLIVKVSEVIGSFKTVRKMALFWVRLVAELRILWLLERHIPGIPSDEVPDLNCCLLYQQMQLFNCCVSRKKRRALATKSLDSLIRKADCDVDGVPSKAEIIPSGSFPYCKTPTGEVHLRLGAKYQADNLAMLGSGESIYAPLTQEGPLLTEDLAREAEEFVLRTGSVGAGCSQLLSDMQAFKAANPGCILEDFVRWHSPPDWTETEPSNDADACSAEGDSMSSRGRLSSRMQKPGNLWRELWETAKPVPAVRQTVLFDEDLAMEGVFTSLEEISPSQLFGQLFLSLLGLGFVIAEANLPADSNATKVFYECKDFVLATCQGDAWLERIYDLCQVYETVEAIYVRPEDVVMKVEKQVDDINTSETPTPRLKKFTRIFGGKNKVKKTASELEENVEEHSFSKKPPRPESHASQHDESEWSKTVN